MGVRLRKSIDKVLQELEEEKQSTRYSIPFSYCKTTTNSFLKHTKHGVIHYTKTIPNTF